MKEISNDGIRFYAVIRSLTTFLCETSVKTNHTCKNRDFQGNFLGICWPGRSTYKHRTISLKNQICSFVLEVKNWDVILPNSEQGTVCKL